MANVTTSIVALKSEINQAASRIKSSSPSARGVGNLRDITTRRLRVK